MVHLSHPYMTSGKTIALTIGTFVGKVPSLLFNMLSKFFILFITPTSGFFFFSFRVDVDLFRSLDTGEGQDELAALGLQTSSSNLLPPTPPSSSNHKEALAKAETIK